MTFLANLYAQWRANLAYRRVERAAASGCHEHATRAVFDALAAAPPVKRRPLVFLSAPPSLRRRGPR